MEKIKKDKIKVLYVRHPDTYGGGVRAYSQIVIDMLEKYASATLDIVDLLSLIDIIQRDERVAKSIGIRELVNFLDQRGHLAGFDVVITDIGLLEHREFLFINYLKQIKPSLKSLVTIHDPDSCVVNLFPFFERYEKYRFVRGCRKVFNLLFSDFIERNFYRQDHNVITLTDRAKKSLQNKLRRLKCHDVKVMVIKNPHMIDVAPDFLATPNNGKLKIGYFGYISYSKGLDILLSAIFELRSNGLKLTDRVEFVFAGGAISNSDQAYFDSLRAFSRKNKLDDVVNFPGFLKSSEVPEFISGLDLLILPYRETGSGSASGPLMWARTYGVPVLASKSRNFIDEIHDMKDGLIFDNETPGDMLKDKLNSYLTDGSIRKNLQVGARNVSEDCSWVYSASRITELISTICEL